MIDKRITGEVIKILNLAVKGEKATEIEYAKYDFKILKHNGLGAIAYLTNLHKFSSDEVKKEIIKEYDNTVYEQSSQKYYQDEIFGEFEKLGVEYLPMKGEILRNLYPIPEMRYSCDVDFYYYPEYEEKVFNVMKKYGFLRPNMYSDHHTLFQNENVTFEGHYDLTVEEYSEFFKEKVASLKGNGTLKKELSNEDFYLYFITHSAHHFEIAGFGIRTVLDLYLYNKKVDFNKEYCQNELEKLGFKTFENKMTELCQVWFENGESSEELDLLTDFIFTSGSYGLAVNGFYNNMEGTTESQKSLKTKMFFKRLFPPYKTLKKRYAWLKTPILLPIGWLVRIVSTPFKNKKALKGNMRAVKNANLNEYEKIKKVREIVGIK